MLLSGELLREMSDTQLLPSARKTARFDWNAALTDASLRAYPGHRYQPPLSAFDRSA